MGAERQGTLRMYQCLEGTPIISVEVSISYTTLESEEEENLRTIHETRMVRMRQEADGRLRRGKRTWNEDDM